MIPSLAYNGLLIQYKQGHNTFGENNHFWNGGRWQDDRGYWHIYSPNHPFRTSDGYVLEHRLVMETYLGRYLTKEEVVHHIDKNTSNNKIENLELFSNNNEHVIERHIRVDMSDRLCLLCGNKTRIDKRGYECWHIYQDGFICNLCYGRNRQVRRY